jgi:hypothetical protein
MRQISDADYKKIVVGLGLILVLTLVFKLRTADSGLRNEEKLSSNPQSIIRNPQSDPSIDLATRTLTEFQAEQLMSEKPAVSYVGRNLFNFNNASVREHPTFSSDIDSASELPQVRAEATVRREVHAPSIQLSSLEPSMVYTNARYINLVVRGQGFRPEMKIYINGKPEIVTTRFVSDRELQATLPAGALIEARNLQIEVKKPEDAALSFSNPLTFSIAPLPFSFVGEITEEGGRNMRVLLLGEDERWSAAIGELLKDRWRIVSIAGDYLELEDTQLGSRHRLKKGEPVANAVKSEPTRQPAEQATANESSDQDDSNASSSAEPGVNLLARPQRPMTYKELLQRRAAMRQKHR